MATTPPARADGPVGGRGSPLIARRGLFERLSTGGPAGVTLVSAPAGSGKTVLLRSWIDEAGLADHVAWVTVERGERDPQRFWLAVVEKLRTAVGADAFIEKLTPAPEFDGEAVVERLVSELGSLEEPVLLVLDDLQELHSQRRSPSSSSCSTAGHACFRSCWPRAAIPSSVCIACASPAS